MLFAATASASCFAGLPAAFDNGAGTVMYRKSTGILVAPAPTALCASNGIATVSAVNATNAAQDAANLATNLSQDAAIASKVSTNAMGSGLTLSNGQWIVTSQGTVTNIEVSGKGGSVSNGIASVDLTASDVGAMPSNVAVGAWSNVGAAATYPTNATINGTQGVVSNGEIHLTLPLGAYATTGSVVVVSSSVAVVAGNLTTVSNTAASLVADNTLTSVVAVASNAVGSAKVGRIGYVYVPTNAPASDASLWSTNPAIANVNLAGYGLTNVSSLSVTGRLAIGFGVFPSTNDVAAPATSNTWVVYAATVAGTNYLLGVDWQTNRTWIGGHP